MAKYVSHPYQPKTAISAKRAAPSRLSRFFLDAPRPLCLETMLRACLYSIKVDVKSLHILYLFNLCYMHNIDKLIKTNVLF